MRTSSSANRLNCGMKSDAEESSEYWRRAEVTSRKPASQERAQGSRARFNFRALNGNSGRKHSKKKSTPLFPNSSVERPNEVFRLGGPVVVGLGWIQTR